MLELKEAGQKKFIGEESGVRRTCCEHSRAKTQTRKKVRGTKGLYVVLRTFVAKTLYYHFCYVEVDKPPYGSLGFIPQFGLHSHPAK
jgi:hypothetical protein